MATYVVRFGSMGRTSLFTAPLGHTHPETKIAPLLISLDVYAQQANSVALRGQR
jgi:hypothetical protein